MMKTLIFLALSLLGNNDEQKPPCHYHYQLKIERGKEHSEYRFQWYKNPKQQIVVSKQAVYIADVKSGKMTHLNIWLPQKDLVIELHQGDLNALNLDKLMQIVAKPMRFTTPNPKRQSQAISWQEHVAIQQKWQANEADNILIWSEKWQMPLAFEFSRYSYRSKLSLETGDKQNCHWSSQQMAQAEWIDFIDIGDNEENLKLHEFIGWGHKH